MKWIKVLVPTAALALVAVLALAGWANVSAGPSKAKLDRPGAALDEAPIDTAINGDQCVAGTLNDCDDYPVPVGGSCSCTWEVTTLQCQCTNGRRGHLEGNACTVCGPCSGPNCHIYTCNTYHSYVCIEGL